MLEFSEREDFSHQSDDISHLFVLEFALVYTFTTHLEHDVLQMEPGHSYYVISKKIILLNHFWCFRAIKLILGTLDLICRIHLHSNIQVQNVGKLSGILCDTLLLGEEVKAIDIHEVTRAEFPFPRLGDLLEQVF